MAQTENSTKAAASLEEIQQKWTELVSRVSQLEVERGALEHQNKNLRQLLGRVIEHRQKSHGELVLLLAGLASKLPISDIGVTVTRLVEHNAHVSEVCAALAGGKADDGMPQPTVLRELDQTKRELAAALKPAVDDLIALNSPLPAELLRELATNPKSYFSPPVIRANRCFAKGQVPRERIVRDFGEQALVFFNDMTTDPKLNPRPKAEEIVLSFKSEFEAMLAQHSALTPEKRQGLVELHQRVQRSKAHTEEARLQRNAFLKLSFLLELLHYYENQNTETPEVAFAQRLPALIEQLAVSGGQEALDEKSLQQAEALLAYIIIPDHRLMVINNLGKGGGAAKTLRYTLKLRIEKLAEADQVIAEFIKHLIPMAPKPAPSIQSLAATLRHINASRQRRVVKAIMVSDRMRREDAQALALGVGKELGIAKLEEELKTQPSLPVEMERQMAWERIKESITSRTDPVNVAAAIRDRLHSRYDADELKQSWLTLIEADSISLIRIFCQLPYLADGSTDPIARTVLGSYVSRLTHEKYAGAYQKVLNSLRNMLRANPNSPTLVNFMALVRWVDAEAANRMSADIGIPVAA